MTNLNSPNSDNDRLGIYQPSRKSSKRKKFVILFIVLALLGTGTWIASHYLTTFNKIFTTKKSIFTRVGGLFISNDKPLIGEDSGAVNVLLLGIGGEGHDGAYLTDTMIVASIKPKTGEVVLTSIPRDWLTPIPGRGLNKINAAYAYGLQDHPTDPNAAGLAAIAAAEKVTGFKIPYYAQIDFKGFVRAVDHVGGVDITVDRTFSDSTFPNDFPFDTKGVLGTVTFHKGTQHMDGRTALIFARSRHGTNDEGSDFARSERQKKIIIALKDKLTGLDISNISTLNKLLGDFTSNFKTNMEPYELLRMAKIGKEVKGENVFSLSLEPQGNLICDATLDQLTGKPYIRPVIPSEETTPSVTPPPSGSTNTTKSTTPPSTGTKTTTGTGTVTKTPSQPTGTTTPTPAPNPTPPPTSLPSGPVQIPMYVVQPCFGKTLDDIHIFLTNFWDTARFQKEAALVEVQNSTGKSSATAALRQLSEPGLKISFISYPGKTAFERSIIYDNTKGTKPFTLQYLKDHYDLTSADVQFTNSKADFVIVLGNDSL